MEELKVSRMSGKLKGLQGINTSPLTNPFCNSMQKSKGDNICKHCYSRKMVTTFRRNALPSWERNGNLLSTKIVGIDFPYPKLKGPLVRFNAHGELINGKHFINLCRIALKYPEIQFALWTKRKELIQQYPEAIPFNMEVVYSEPKIDDLSTEIPEGFDKIFIVTSKKEHLSKGFPCHGKKCFECRECYGPYSGVIIELLK